MDDIYTQLREHLDKLSTGFPSTESGVEIRILKKLFTVEEAALFLRLNPMLEPIGSIASRLGEDPAALGSRLEAMAAKGLLFRLRKGGSVQYSAAAFVVGILEFQVNAMDREMAEYLEEYHAAAIGKTFQGFGTPLVRTIPLNRDVAEKFPIAPYDDAMRILSEQKTIMVTKCLCRMWGRLLDKGCTRPLECCFTFGSLADYYVENGMGRYVSAEDAQSIITRALAEHPFVVQVSNGRKIGGMCLCCGDCCGMLRSLKLQAKPADAVKSNYYAEADTGACTGCGSCVDVCQMDAIGLSEGSARVDLDRCIGCGLCVRECPSGALTLEKKDAASQYTPPETMTGTYIEIARRRGIIG